MKNKIKILTFIAAGFIFFTSCQKDPDLRMPSMGKAVVPTMSKDAAKDQTIDYYNLNDFDGGVVIDLFYPDKPKSLDLMVTYNGWLDSTGVLQANITTFPTTVNLTLAQLGTATGKDVLDLIPGDKFTVFVKYTLANGTVVDGRDTLSNAFNSSIQNLPGLYLTTDFTVVCPLTLSDFEGDWWMDDGSPSDLCVINLAIDPAKPTNGLILDGFYNGTGTGAIYPIYLEVNLSTYAFTLVPSSQIFAAWLWNPAYLNATLSNMAGLLDPCTDSFTMKADLNVSLGSFGRQSYVCTRY